MTPSQFTRFWSLRFLKVGCFYNVKYTLKVTNVRLLLYSSLAWSRCKNLISMRKRHEAGLIIYAKQLDALKLYICSIGVSFRVSNWPKSLCSENFQYMWQDNCNFDFPYHTIIHKREKFCNTLIRVGFLTFGIEQSLKGGMRREDLKVHTGWWNYMTYRANSLQTSWFSRKSG